MVKANRWITGPKPNPQAKLRLFCFPYAGGGAQSFRGWPDGLPSAVEVCPIQLPGRETRMKEEPFSHVAPLVKELAPAIVSYLDKPFAFFGHSMGALVAFELARELAREHKLTPAHLFVSGRGAPHLPILREPLNRLPDAEFIEALKHLNGTPKEVLENAELMRIIAPLLRADFAVNEEYTYEAGPPLDCPIFAIGGLQDSEANRETLAAWREHTSAAFMLRMLPGDHFFLVTAQSLFLQLLSQELYQVVRKL